MTFLRATGHSVEQLIPTFESREVQGFPEQKSSLRSTLNDCRAELTGAVTERFLSKRFFFFRFWRNEQVKNENIRVRKINNERDRNWSAPACGMQSSVGPFPFLGAFPGFLVYICPWHWRVLASIDNRKTNRSCSEHDSQLVLSG